MMADHPLFVVASKRGAVRIHEGRRVIDGATFALCAPMESIQYLRDLVKDGHWIKIATVGGTPYYAPAPVK